MTKSYVRDLGGTSRIRDFIPNDDVAAGTIFGRADGAGTGPRTDLTPDQLAAILNLISNGLITLAKDPGGASVEGGQFQLQKPNSTSLAGDVTVDCYTNSIRVFEGGGTARGFNVDLTGCAGGATTKLLTTGLETIWLPAAGMVGYVGAAPGQSTYSSGNFSAITFDFDQTTLEAVDFQITMPKSWDKGPVFFVPYWTASGGAGGVVWSFFAAAISDNEALNATLSTTVTSTDTFQAADKLHIGPITSGLTPDGSPANDDIILFSMNRTPGNASDTLTADARLIGVKILYTTNAANDT